jgi:hypothetical protein
MLDRKIWVELFRIISKEYKVTTNSRAVKVTNQTYSDMLVFEKSLKDSETNMPVTRPSELR